MILEKLDDMEFSGVLLRVIRFRKLVLDKVFPVDLGCSCTLLDL